MNDLPRHYFRVRENGAAVFRLDTENRQRRIEMEQIAVINTNRGDYKAQSGYTLLDDDIAAIEEWLAERATLNAQRNIDDIHRAIDQMNITTHWVQSKATDEQLEEITDRFLLAMHDLRSVLVRKKADRMNKPADD
ncbi:hypothetical protein [Loktanella sp. S4079]|uniref:hypothetical protein n=1 Tax=Loktanella sp. S4079 TaxID=579483 RepID=UPI0005FA69EC|nr:hypothetical protein [Loktanella sp. S4079]KJZ19763.1 hypothetical protein TW80_02385 [Loktanella sp. S4079]